MGRRIGLLLGSVAVALGLGTAPAVADHHLVKIAEVYASNGAAVEYVQLEMTSGGQNLFGGTGSTVTLRNSDGTVITSVDVNEHVANGQRGRRVLIGSENLADVFGSAAEPEFTFAGDHLGTSGAACFTSGEFGPIDCVSWGSYTGPALPSATGANAAPAGLPDGSALRRRRPPCGPGLIDTNSPSDWVQVPPDPFNNAAPAATNTPCPQTRITKKPGRRTTKRRAIFKFTATQGVDEFKCKLDRSPFRNCSSPFRKRVKRGRHTFKVRAAGDASPATHRWKVVRPD